MSFYDVKSVSASVKDVDVKNRQVKLYFSKFGNIDSDMERVIPGAFEKTFRENGPKGKNRIWHLIDHTPSLKSAIGKPIELLEDNYGALAVSKIIDTEKNDTAKDVMVLYDEGMINEHSFGYSVLKADVITENGEDIRELKELAVYEYSSVLWGANEFTPTVEVKSLAEVDQLEERIKDWTKILKKGNLTNEFCELLEIQLKQLAQQVATLRESLKGADSRGSSTTTPSDHEPPPSTREDKEPDEQGAKIIELWKNLFSNLTRETWNQNSMKS